MHVVEFKRTINIVNADTKENDMDIEKWTANENNIYGYVAKDKKGNIVGTKFFMEHVKINEVAMHFRRDIRQGKVKGTTFNRWAA